MYSRARVRLEQSWVAGQPVERRDRARGTRTLEINRPTWKQSKEGGFGSGHPGEQV